MGMGDDANAASARVRKAATQSGSPAGAERLVFVGVGAPELALVTFRAGAVT
jgi:hypothetical protein